MEIQSSAVTLSMLFPWPPEEIWFVSPVPRVLTCSLQSICLTEVISSLWWTKIFNISLSSKTLLKPITAEGIVSRCVEPCGSR